MRNKKGPIVFSLAVALAFALLAEDAAAVRIKDIADIEGVRDNQLIGYGLVIGLDGSGDSNAAKFTQNSMINMLENMGVTVQPGDIKAGNVAAVMVTAELPPFIKRGSRIDVLISSIGNAKSLQGGTLLLTPLRAPNGSVYAVAQGPLSIGGFAAEGGGDSVQKNHPTVGKIIGGAIVEKEVPYNLGLLHEVNVTLHSPDFSTVARMAEAINQRMDARCAKAVDGATVAVEVLDKYRESTVEMLAILENVNIIPESFAKVVLNERTGTIIMGEDVKISTVAISHGNLNIQINSRTEISQPLPFSSGVTVENTNADITVMEDEGDLHVVRSGVSIGDLVRALNAIGVTPRDLIAILQAIKEAGALQARLEIL